MLESCAHEDDGTCDVPELCDPGTDVNDCKSSGSNPCVCKKKWNGIGAYSNCRDQCGCTSCDSTNMV